MCVAGFAVAVHLESISKGTLFVNPQTGIMWEPISVFSLTHARAIRWDFPVAPQMSMTAELCEYRTRFTDLLVASIGYQELKCSILAQHKRNSLSEIKI